LKRLGCVAIAAVLLLVAVALRIWVWGDKQSGPAGGGAPVKPPAVVEVALASAGGLPGGAVVTGTIIPEEQVELRPETNGRIVWLQMPEGRQVSSGQLLARLNDAELRAQEQKIIAQSALARQREERLASLRQSGGVSADEYEIAENTRKSLDADLEATRARIALCEIRAPFSGTLGLRRVSVGSMVGPAEVLGTITQTDGLKLEFSVPARYAASIALGDKVRFTVEGGRDTLIAKVFATEGSLDAGTRTLNIRARVEGHHRIIKAGMYAAVFIDVLPSQQSVTVPTEAIVPVLKGAQVFVVKNGMAVPKDVLTGLRSESRVEILDGISAGDSIVVRGLLGLKPGAPVKIVPGK
jgi:membrane fusion protein, multidrug efflux system